jgi:hypothetical protein
MSWQFLQAVLYVVNPKPPEKCRDKPEFLATSQRSLRRSILCERRGAARNNFTPFLA